MSITTDTKNNLGNRDDTRVIEFVRVEEKIQIEEQTTTVDTQTIGNSWIVGSSTNGLVGTNTATQGGGQQVVGSSGRTTATSSRANPNNTYRERLITDTFNNSGVTTATWASDGQIGFTVGEIAQSLSVQQGLTIGSAILTVDDDTNLTLQLSADGGTHWETVTNNTQHSFTNTGDDLRFKFTATGTATVTNIKIVYG